MTSRRELTGYAVPMVARPGDTVRFMVSTEAEDYRASIVRLIHGDTNPAGPGYKAIVVDTVANRTYPGRLQRADTGSFVRIDPAPALDVVGGVTLQAWIWPTIPDAVEQQGIITRTADSRGYGLFMEAGAVSLRIGSGTVATAPGLVERRWHFVAGTWDARTGTANVQWRCLEPGGATASASADLHGEIDAEGAPLLLAAGVLAGGGSGPADCLNGKLEHPRVFDRALRESELDALANDADPTELDGLVAAWDFSASDPHTTVALDAGPGRLDGTIVNFPMRGLTGHLWDGSAFRRQEAPAHYGAVHFHATDFDDSRWEPDFEFEIPAQQRSGFYAARLDGAGERDHIPFFVSPPSGVSNAAIGFLIPTNTYLAYGNERLLTDSGGQDFSGLTNIPTVLHPLDEFLAGHRDFGGSIYDVHPDGSGISYSTSRRPIVSMRPDHRNWVTGGPRHLALDLDMVDWLETKGYTYDTFTDEDLHLQGVERLAAYKVIVTASHPEYWSRQMLDALEGYLGSGGRLMYLGGNGFYWATAFDPDRPHVIEVRRGVAGTRAWESHPGEMEMASTGEPAGLWRHLGRPPNALVGVGFAGQGWDLDAPGYRRLPDSHDPRAAFIFEGIGDDEEIGEFGLVMNGAAGDELDRTDNALGTPSHALVLATSAGLHSDFFLVCHEDILVTQAELAGSNNPNVRADMVYFDTGDGGAVFSVGSINWFASLSHNGYDNNVSRITENVLRQFLS